MNIWQHSPSFRRIIDELYSVGFLLGDWHHILFYSLLVGTASSTYYFGLYFFDDEGAEVFWSWSLHKTLGGLNRQGGWFSLYLDADAFAWILADAGF